MARSLSNAKLLVASVADGLSLPVFRRGYAAAPHGVVSGSFGRGGATSGMMGKVQETAMMKEDSGAISAWAPDPITGYYRPANTSAQIDPVELREMLLNHRVRAQ
ncbi:Late embryogenesis abundant protein Lea5 [Turnera subulata]|uniref:Late embryogenesis abundant protein Lea5 n=1 Tax=Turnera subulata TaxID=218843 RepID=A0A9Q0FMC6_9ROSI|nr:Late embryogenesis abundant protein Lea5 [Turnera subulata]